MAIESYGFDFPLDNFSIDITAGENRHAVLGTCMAPPYPDHCDSVLMGLGCFWGAEKQFWELPGIYTTAVGYAGGNTIHPNYEQICADNTQHAEVVMIVYDPALIPFSNLLRVFWESHDPTQGWRQGNDVGSQYRSCLFCTRETQFKQAQTSLQTYQLALQDAGYGEITSEIIMAPPFYYAENNHQQYLAKNPGGYCGIGGTGVPCYLTAANY